MVSRSMRCSAGSASVGCVMGTFLPSLRSGVVRPGDRIDRVPEVALAARCVDDMLLCRRCDPLQQAEQRWRRMLAPDSESAASPELTVRRAKRARRVERPIVLVDQEVWPVVDVENDCVPRANGFGG